MKAVVLLAVTMVAAPQVCSAKSLSVNITRTGTNTVFVFCGRPCLPQLMSVIVGRLASISKNTQVDVRVDASATAADLAQVLHIVQQAGFRNVVIIAPGVQNGKAGHYLLPIDAAKRPIGGRTAGSFVESGFHPSDEVDVGVEGSTVEIEGPEGPRSSQHPPERDK